MFTYKNIDDSYIIRLRHVMPDDTIHSYSAKIDVFSFRKDREHYIFTLLKRHDVLINGEKPTEASDLVMIEIGESLYPLELAVNLYGTVTSIENFNEIKERWTNKRKELFEKYPTKAFEQYLSATEKNMQDCQHFLDILQRDAFVQFYFMPVASDAVRFDLANFPVQGETMQYVGIKSQKALAQSENSYTILPVFTNANILLTNGTMRSHQHKEGDYEHVTISIDLFMDKSTRYQRTVKLSKDPDYKRSVNLWFY